MTGWIRTSAVVAFLLVGGVSAATASTMEMSLQEVADDLIFDFRGKIDITNRSPRFTTGEADVNEIDPTAPRINSLPGQYARYDFGGALTDPFGTGPLVSYDRPTDSTSTGQVFGFSRIPFLSGGGTGALFLPSDYESGNELEGQAVFFGRTLDGIGAEPGQYSYIYGNNTLNLTVGPDTAVIPLPASGILLVLALAGLGLMHWRRDVG